MLRVVMMRVSMVRSVMVRRGGSGIIHYHPRLPRCYFHPEVVDPSDILSQANETCFTRRSQGISMPSRIS